CPPPPSARFADVTVKAYAPETKLYYICDSGYDRRSGKSLRIQCKSDQQGAYWVYNKIECIDEKILLSTAPMMELEFTQKPEIKTMSPAPQKQENLSEFAPKGFCGPPKTFPHASLSMDRSYYVGQVLHFKCQSGYDKRFPISGNSTCTKENGMIIWTPFDMRCTSDS
ncbi:I15RA protein, partial [Smithornis capensis]|nr:I15RA protein [Smithornis capensis]